MADTTTLTGPGGARMDVDAEDARILDAVLAVSATGSLEDDPRGAVAREAGITVGQLRERYPDLRELLVDALRWRDDRGIEGMDTNERDGRGLLRSFLAIARGNVEAPGTVALFTTLSAAATSPDHPGHEYFAERYAWLRGILVDALRELEEEGELIDGADPLSIATQTIALLDGLQVQWLLDRTAVDMSALVRGFLDVWLLDPL